MRTTTRTLLGAVLSLLVTFGSTHRASAQTDPDRPILFSGPVDVQMRVKPPRYTTVHHILSMNPDGGGIRQLTIGLNAASRPSWSPDGRYIAFIRCGMLTVMEAIGEPEAGVFEVCPAWNAGHDWAPDGRSIVFCGSSVLGGGLWDVAVNPDTGEVGTPELVCDGYCGDPSWSPDGTRIAFNGDYGKVTILDLLDGKEIRFNRSSISPTWNPTGDKLAVGMVACDLVGKDKKAETLCFYEIWTVNVGTGWSTRVTHLESFSAFPAFSPEGTQLVFRSDVDEKLGPSLYGVTIGGDTVTLPYGGGIVPNWAP